MGVCPQHDLLFEYLTVDEHLYFFGGIKGVPIDLIDEEANSLMTRLGINHCRKNWAGRLSGGERRKLSVAISLIGKPEVVYLDEPTAGMDPFSRRCVWELLNEEKQKRVIILTTHYMDEADLLGDRIAIMSNGKIRCLGSSLFLKRKFGGGYHLYVSESQNSASNGVGEESDDDDFFVVNAAKTDSWDIRSVEKTVRKIIPSASLNEDSKSQISFSIPMDNVAKFHDLFTALDSAKGRLGVGSYGISLTSLEEVFLRIAAEGEHGGGFSSDEESDSETIDGPNKDPFGMDVPSDSPCDSFEWSDGSPQRSDSINTESSIIDIFPPADEPHLLTPNSGPASWSGQATGLLLKKLATFRRSMHSYFFKLFWPFSYVTSLLAALRAAPAFQNIAPPSFQLDNNAQYMAFFRDFFVHLAGSTSSAFSNLAKLMDFTSLRRPGSANILGVRPADAIHAILRNATEPTVASVAADTLRFDEGVLNMTLFHNASAPHMSPILMGTVDNALSQLMANCSIHSINHPYPYPHATDFAEISALILPITFGISFPIIADSFGMDAMREKSRRSKHLQLVMGLRPWVYWAANFAFDFTFFLIPIFLMYGCFEWYGEATLMGEAFLPSLSLFLAYGAAALSFSYLLSQYFVRFAAYSTFSTTVKRIISMSLFVACVVLEKVPAVKSCPLFPLLRLLFCLSPQFSLMFGLYQVLVMNQSINQQRELCILRKMPLCVTPTSSDFFALDMMGGTLAVTIFAAILYFSLTIICEYGMLRGFSEGPPEGEPMDIQPLPYEDPDVFKERVRMRAKDIPGETVRLINLQKLYPMPGKTAKGEMRLKMAIGKLTLGIQAGERFGLLGPNGAGKTSAVSIMTGSQYQSAGTCRVGGHDVFREIFKVYKKIGLCPQADALDELLTGREHLVLYARIKGIPEKSIDFAVDKLLSLMDLHKYADRVASKYSGGNKRKLNVAISLMSRPQIAMLDEPSTGMDPVSRRRLWDTILCEMKEQSIILTTHSMEEAEALCSRIGIMVNGVLKCLGTPQHLKSIHGKGYQIEVRCNPSSKMIKQCETFLLEVLPEAELVEAVGGRLRFTLEKVDVSLAKIFGTLESSRVEFDIEDYSVSQATLEQVFINFAKVQEEPLYPVIPCDEDMDDFY